MAGCLKGLVGHFHNQICISFPVRAPDHACLTKPASSGAAPGDFQYDAVMDGLHKRHNWCDRVRPGIQINGFPFFNNGFFAMHTGNINAADFRQLFDDRLSCEGLLFRGTDSGGNFRDNFFAFTNDKSIDETFKRHGIEGAGPSGDDQRVILEAVIRLQRDSSHVHHVKHVRIGQFILQRKADDVESPHWHGGFKRCQGKVMIAKLSFPVRPGSKTSFGGNAWKRVQNGVENLQPKMRHAHFIGIGKGKQKADIGFVFTDGVDFRADVAAGFFGNGQQLVGNVLGHDFLFV